MRILENEIKRYLPIYLPFLNFEFNVSYFDGSFSVPNSTAAALNYVLFPDF